MSAAAIAAGGGCARRPEPEQRRTHQRVHRRSRYIGGEQRVKIAWAELPDLKRALSRLSQEQHKPGRRRGHAGTISLAHEQVMIALMEMSAKFRGNVCPTLAGIARWARVGLTVVKEAIAIFEDLKLLEHDRRIVIKAGAEPGARGPQVEQTSNFYRVLVDPLREVLARLKGPRAQAAATARAQREAAKAAAAKAAKAAAWNARFMAQFEAKHGPAARAQLEAKLARHAPSATRSR